MPQASAAGPRAGHPLLHLHAEFRCAAAGQFGEAAARLPLDARELERKQKALSEQLAQADASEPQPGLRGAGTGGRAQVAEELQAQKQELERLLEEMRKTIEESETAEPLLSKKLYDAVRATRQQKTDEALDVSSRLLDQGFLDEARQLEGEASAGITKLRAGVEQAAQSVLGDEGEALRRAQAELDALAQELEREIDSKQPATQPGTRPAGNGERLARGDRPTTRGTTRDGANRGGETSGEPGTPGEPSTGGVARGEDGEPTTRPQGAETAGGRRPGLRPGASEQARAGERPATQPGGAQPGEGSQGERQASASQPGEGQPGAEQPGQRQPGSQSARAERPGEGQRGGRTPGGQQPGEGQRGEGEQPGNGARPGENGKPSESSSPGQGEGETAEANAEGRQSGEGQQPGGQGARPGQASSRRGGLREAGAEGRGGNPTGQPQGEDLRRLSAGVGSGPAGAEGPLTGAGFRGWSDRLRDVEEMVNDPRLRAEAARIRERAREVRGEFNRHAKEPDWALVREFIGRPLVELRDRVADEVLRRGSSEAMVPIDRDPVPPAYADQVREYYERLGGGR